MDYSLASLIVAGIAGLLCGFLNTVASSGSAVSLPILMWLGLTAVDANATNRLPVLIGAITATTDLARHGKIPWRMALLAAVPTTIGAVIGAFLAEAIPSSDLRIFIVVAVAMALVLILTKLKEVINKAVSRDAQFGRRESLLFLAVGVWLGFIVLDGATYLLLTLVLAVGLPLISANATKNFLLVPTTLVAMAIFASRGSIDWGLGGIMAIGSIAGGVLGAQLSVSEQAKRWIVGLLIVVIIGELIHLSIRYYFEFFS
jgi:uncharacterized membrane protein YfcA